ncbi:hypothetical protein [Streptomyces sp. CBMA156]|uniref:hypothetical protein n=1 Tax=Streptomyces sp. CBMA156 TaxID=1930280 RepID=UPI0016620DCC|nr:hypothetical protein [Streptomyces sp. CBMA156]MBD0676299.1 hypothetical protein [Streptomyces sp. CBMA156]MBD0676774.1 hypothetical protein [Streptomyces sp. CBMA156]
MPISVSDVLMEDVLFATGIPVDASSPKPVAVFRNPSQGQVWDHQTKAWVNGYRLEALVISAVGAVRKVHHLIRDPEAAHGWRVSDVDFGTPTPPAQLVAFNPGGEVWCLMIAEDEKAYMSYLQQDGTWAKALPVGSRTYESVETSFDGEEYPLAYLRVRNSPDSACFTAPDWSECTELDSLPNDRLAYGSSSDNGARDCVFGAAVQSGRVTTGWTRLGREPGGNYLGEFFPEDGKEARQVVELYCDDNGHEVKALVLNTDGSFSTGTFSAADANGKLVPAGIPGLPQDVTFTRVVSYLSREGTAQKPEFFRDLYAIDAQHRLWVVRRARGGTDGWLPPLPIDKNIGGIAATGGYLGETALFSWAPDGGQLNLDIRDGRTGRWRGVHVLPPTSKPEQYKGNFHRVEALVRTEEGVPLPRHPVTLATHDAAADCEVFWTVPGAMGPPLMHTITADPTPLITDAEGRLTLTLRADTLASSELLLTADGVTVQVKPGAKVLNYLKGSGTLRETDPRGPLPTFDQAGHALAAAKIAGPDATDDNLAQCAALVGKVAAHGLATPPQLTPLYRTLDGGPQFRSIWGDIGDLVGDAWHGIKNGLIKVGEVIKKGADWVCQKLTALGQELGKDASLVIKGIETAAHAIVSVLRAIGAAIEKVIEWLKALFHFKDIWETKMAVEQAFQQATKSLNGGIALLKENADQWLERQKTELADVLDKFKSELTGNGVTTVSATTAASGAANPKVATATSDPQARWFSEKVHHAGSPTGSLATSLAEGSGGTGPDLLTVLTSIEEAFVKEAVLLSQQLASLLNPPEALADAALAKLVDDLKNFLLTLMDLARKLVDSFLDLLEDGLGQLAGAASKELHWGPLNALWAGMAALAGHGDDDKLTLGGVVALLIAFPATIGYKIATGDSAAKLFPGGKLPGHGQPTPAESLVGDPADPVAPTSIALAKGCYATAGFATILQAIPLVWLDFAAPQEQGEISSWLPYSVCLAGLGATVLTVVGQSQDTWDWDKILDAGIVAGATMTGVGYLAGILATKFDQSAWTRFAPIVVTLSGGVGLAWVVYAVVEKNITGPVPIGGAFIGTLPALFGFLSLPALADDEWVRLAHAAVDVIANQLAGAANIIGAFSSSS